MNKINKQAPPKILEKILEFLLPPSESFHLIGSYEELYREKAIGRNKFIASCWYCFQILISVPGFIKENITWGTIMFLKNLKITLRNLSRNKTFTAISVLSLMIGITVMLYAVIINNKVLTIDNSQINLKRIYRLGNGNTPSPIKKVVADNVPEVEAIEFTGGLWDKLIVNNSRPLPIENPLVAGPEFAKIFTINVLDGNLENALTEPMSLAITDREAERLFGSENPLGKVVSFGGVKDLIIKALIEEMPANSTIKFGALVSSTSMKEIFYGVDQFTDWGRFNYTTLILLKEKVDVKFAETKINEAINKHKPEDRDPLEYNLIPYENIVLNPEMSYSSSYVSVSFLIVISLIAILILLTGILNYTNMSISRATQRAKEIGIRKASGAGRDQIFKLLIGESLIISFIASLGSVLILNLVVQKLNQTMNAGYILVDFFNPVHLILFLFFVLLISFIAGFYPAAYLANLDPVKILKRDNLLTKKNSILKKGFIVFQVAVSVFLILCSVLLNNQMEYIINHEPGFKTNGVLYCTPSTKILKNIDVFKNELLTHKNIENVTCGHSTLAGSEMSWGTEIKYKGEQINVNFKALPVNANYIDFMGLKIVKGRNFTEADSGRYIVNETFVNKYCKENPFEARFEDGDYGGEIIGVVKDFNSGSLKEAIPPVAFVLNKHWIGAVNIQLKKLSSTQTKNTIKFIEDTWYRLSPGYPFAYDFVDSRIKRFYARENELQTIALVSTIISIIIASLGLFSFVSFAVERRTKEIGIRKVLGASEVKLINIIGKEFVWLTAIAIAIAVPSAYYLMGQWLSNFAYKAEISPAVILVSIFLSILLVFSVVGFKIIKAARNNPVDSLKYE